MVEYTRTMSKNQISINNKRTFQNVGDFRFSISIDKGRCACERKSRKKGIAVMIDILESNISDQDVSVIDFNSFIFFPEN